MKRLIPPKKVREEFYLTYELKGAQKGINLLARYYGIRQMKIVLDGKKVGRGYEACYDKFVGYFTKKGFHKRNVLHEFYHHISFILNFDMDEKEEEKEANNFVKNVLKYK